jgi:hypothetical protein
MSRNPPKPFRDWLLPFLVCASRSSASPVLKVSLLLRSVAEASHLTRVIS